MAQLLEAVAGLGEQMQGMAQEIVQMKTQQARAAEAAAAEAASLALAQMAADQQIQQVQPR